MVSPKPAQAVFGDSLGVVVIEVMIPFPFTFDVVDEFREGNRRELTKVALTRTSIIY